MDRKNKGFLKTLNDLYKNLPLKMRVKVNTSASKLLDLQKENSALAANAGDRSEADERGEKGE
jgi:hypothetical protein